MFVDCSFSITLQPTFREESAFKTWLYSIGRNIAYDNKRKKNKISEVPLENYNNTSEVNSLEKEYIKNEEKIMLRRTIDKLKPEYKQILYLIYMEGFSHSEASKIMKKNDKQIRDLLYRAKGALKKEIETC